MGISVLRQFHVSPVLRKVVVLQGCLEGDVYGMDMWKDASLQDHMHCHSERSEDVSAMRACRAAR